MRELARGGRRSTYYRSLKQIEYGEETKYKGEQMSFKGDTECGNR